MTASSALRISVAYTLEALTVEATTAVALTVVAETVEATTAVALTVIALSAAYDISRILEATQFQ